MSLRSSFALAFLSSCAFSASALAAHPPANICVELTTWIDQAQAKAAEASANAPAGQSSSSQTAQRAPQAQSNEGGGTAVEQPRPGARQVPSGEDDAQKTSGMSGQVTQDGPGAAGPQGGAQESAKSGAANSKPDERQSAQAAKPATPSEPKAPQPSPQAIEKARQSAAANDLDGCSSAVRDMRLAGVALPAPLLALAVLKPELRQQALKGPAPGVPPIPPSGVTGGEPARPPGAGEQSTTPSR